MASSSFPDLKAEALKEICEHRERILKFVDDTFKAAEEAANMVLNLDGAVNFIDKLQESSQLLKICQERFADVNCSLPTEPLPNQSLKIGISKPLEATNCQIPLAKVMCNEPYKVQIIDGDLSKPTWFWLKLLGCNSTLLKLEEDLRDFYWSHPIGPNLEKPPATATFVVCWSDYKFCRAKVITILESDSHQSNTVQVILVDYGQITTTSLPYLYPIEPRFCVAPAVGLLCGLKDIQPNEGDTWELASTLFFKEQCRGDDLTAIFHPHLEEPIEPFSIFQPDFLVSLHKKGSMEGIVRDIRSILIQQGMAKSGTSRPTPESSIISVKSLGKPPSAFSISSPASPTSTSSNQLVSPAPPSLCPSTTSSKQLNVNAPEFVPPQVKQASLLGAIPVPLLTNTSSSCNFVSSLNMTLCCLQSSVGDSVKGDPFPQTTLVDLTLPSIKKTESLDVTPSFFRSSDLGGEVGTVMKKSSPLATQDKPAVSALLDLKREESGVVVDVPSSSPRSCVLKSELRSTLPTTSEKRAATTPEKEESEIPMHRDTSTGCVPRKRLSPTHPSDMKSKLSGSTPSSLSTSIANVIKPPSIPPATPETRNASGLVNAQEREKRALPMHRDTSTGIVSRKPFSRSSARASSVTPSRPGSLTASPPVFPAPVDAQKSSKEENNDVPTHRKGDELLLNQFLESSLVCSTSNSNASARSDGFSPMSFVSATSHISNSSLSGSGRKDKRPVKIQLDYEYGAVLKPRPPPGSSVLTVQLSYLFHPNHFYVHLKDEVPTLVDPLVKRLNELYRYSEPVPVQRPEIGSFWVAKEKTMNNWARVQIFDTNGLDKGLNKVTVFSVDWGFLEEVELSQLRPLIPQVTKTHCLAFCFRLAGIYPLNQPEDSEDWLQVASDAFLKWVTSEDDFPALIDDKDQQRGQFPVLLFKGNEEEGITINELLVNHKLASSNIFPAPPDLKVDKEEEQFLLNQDLPNWDPMAADYFSFKNTRAIDMENYDSATAGHIPQDDKLICRYFRVKGSCRNGIYCSYKHIKPDKESFTQDRMRVFVDLPALAMPNPGSMVHVQVTGASRSYRFSCVLPQGPRDQKDWRFLPNSHSDETLVTLQHDLQKEYNTNYGMHRVTLDPSAGDIVIARSPDDKLWYRGKVMEELNNEEFAVYFVDCGHNRAVPLKDICLPLDRFTHLPMQSVQMFLNGIDWKSETEKARNELVNLVTEVIKGGVRKPKNLVAHVVQHSPHLLVDLFDTSGPVDINIAEELIRRRVVKRKVSQNLNPSTDSGGKLIAG